MTLLPAALRDADDSTIDSYMEAKMESFEYALDNSDVGRDPVRCWIAKECIRMASDPRVDPREIRARSVALLNSAKVLGLDRDIQRYDANKHNVELALKKLREAALRGMNATGQQLRDGTGDASSEVLEGQALLLRESPPCDLGAEQAGDVRGAVPDAGENSGHH